MEHANTWCIERSQGRKSSQSIYKAKWTLPTERGLAGTHVWGQRRANERKTGTRSWVRVRGKEAKEEQDKKKIARKKEVEYP